MTKPSSQPRSPIGESTPRIDAHDKVTGTAQYADDIQFGNALLYARIKRSPHPHALIKKVDAKRALALPGVKAVVTGADFPGFIGLYLQDRQIFGVDLRFDVVTITDGAQEVIQKYYADRIGGMIDISGDKYDFPGAKKVLQEIGDFYPESVFLQQEDERVSFNEKSMPRFQTLERWRSRRS